jgi:hypothetical protein
VASEVVETHRIGESWIWPTRLLSFDLLFLLLFLGMLWIDTLLFQRYLIALGRTLKSRVKEREI